RHAPLYPGARALLHRQAPRGTAARVPRWRGRVTRRPPAVAHGVATRRRPTIPTELTVSGPASLRGRLRVPGDKGISHRALLFAAMANGRSRAVGLAGGDDVARTRLLLRDLGVDITAAGSGVTVEGRGVEGLREASHVLD